MEPQTLGAAGRASRPAPAAAPASSECPGKLQGWDFLLWMTKWKEDIPEALGIPHSARDKKHGAHGSPGPVFSKPLGEKKEISSSGSSTVLFTLSGNRTFGTGAEQHWDHSESPQGTRDNAEGTAPQTLRSLKRHECQGLLPLLTASPSPLSQPSLLGPGKGQNSDPVPASSWGAQGQQRRGAAGRGAHPASPESGSFPTGFISQRRIPAARRAPPAPHGLGCSHTTGVSERRAFPKI